MSKEDKESGLESVQALLSHMREEFQREQTTPVHEKKLTVPVALASIIVAALVTGTWSVRTFYETEIQSKISDGRREIQTLQMSVNFIGVELGEIKEKLREIQLVQKGNTEDLDSLWEWKNDHSKKNKD